MADTCFTWQDFIPVTQRASCDLSLRLAIQLYKTADLWRDLFNKISEETELLTEKVRKYVYSHEYYKNYIFYFMIYYIRMI